MTHGIPAQARLLFLFRRLQGFRDVGGDMPRGIRLAHFDSAVELPLVFRPIDTDVVNARADDEAQHSAPVVERAAVARVHGSIEAVGSGYEIERRHYEADTPLGFEML